MTATTSEREAAFSWAQEFRLRREALRLDLQEGRLTLDDVVARRHDGIDGAMKVLFVLESLPGARKVATRRRLAELGVAETVPLRSLDDDTCALLLREFPLSDQPAGSVP